MCIGIPMQVWQLEPGHALCRGRGEERRVRSALVGPLSVGDWVLVFLDSAQEILSPQRAAEINATLDLVQHALHGDPLDPAPFALPSAWSRDELLALSGVLPPASAPPAGRPILLTPEATHEP